MRDRNVGKVRIDDLYNLVIVIGQFLKLKIKLVVSSDELHFRRGASDDDELLGEDTFYDKSASIAGSVPGCNITTVRHEKNRRPDWSGHKTRMHHTYNLSLSKDETRDSKPSFLHSFYKSFMESIWQAGTPPISSA